MASPVAAPMPSSPPITEAAGACSRSSTSSNSGSPDMPS